MEAFPFTPQPSGLLCCVPLTTARRHESCTSGLRCQEGSCDACLCTALPNHWQMSWPRSSGPARSGIRVGQILGRQGQWSTSRSVCRFIKMYPAWCCSVHAQSGPMPVIATVSSLARPKFPSSCCPWRVQQPSNDGDCGRRLLASRCRLNRTTHHVMLGAAVAIRQGGDCAVSKPL